MRGSLAAACAAVLVGLSPAGAIPLASWAAAASCTRADAAGHVTSPNAVGRAPADAVAVATAAGDAPAWPELRVPAAWRTPGGPAPSQAPPRA